MSDFASSTVHASPETQQEQSLSGVIELIRNGYELYKRCLRAFLVVGGVMFVASVALSICFDLLKPQLERVESGVVVSLWFPVALFIALIVYLIFVQWIVFGYMQIARASNAHLSAGTALSQASRRVGSFIWISILTFLVICGVAVVFVGVPAAILYFLGEVLVGESAAIGVLSLYTIISVVIVACTFGAGGLFGGWLFLDDVRYSGIRAYVASYRLVQVVGLWRIVGRLVAFTLIVILIALIVGSFLSVLFGAYVGQILFALFESLFLYPVFFGAMAELYKESRVCVDAERPEQVGWFRAAALLGFVAFILLPLAGLVFELITHGSLP